MLLFVLCTISLLPISTFSQQVKFSYDAAGNRTQRIKVYKSSQASVADTIVNEKTEQNKEVSFNSLTFKVFPNPTIDNVTIKCEGWSQTDDVEIILLSVKGDILQQFSLTNNSSPIDLSMYPKGLYLLRVTIANHTEQWKIVKN